MLLGTIYIKICSVPSEYANDITGNLNCSVPFMYLIESVYHMHCSVLVVITRT